MSRGRICDAVQIPPDLADKTFIHIIPEQFGCGTFLPEDIGGFPPK